MDKKAAKTTEDNKETKEKSVKKDDVQPSKESQINTKADSMTEKYGEHFDKDAFKAAAAVYLEKHDTLAGFDAEAFVKKPEDNKKASNDKKDDQMENDEGLCFGLEERDGKIISRGSNGVVFEGKNFEEVNDKVCSYMKNDSLSKGKEPKIGFHCNDESKKEIFSRNAIMKHNVTILAGWPENQKFWQDLKQEYLSDKSHKAEDWERMTRKIPDEVMQRTPEEKARNKKLNDADIIAQMRKGNNPNLQTAAPAGQTPNAAAANVKEAPSQTASPAEKGGKTGNAALIDQMRHGVNPNVPETMPQSNNKTQPLPGQEKQLTPEEIQAAVLRQAKRQHV